MAPPAKALPVGGAGAGLSLEDVTAVTAATPLVTLESLDPGLGA